MDNRTLIRILGQTPEAKLKLTELAERWASPMRNLTWEQQKELEEAIAEASNYVNATRRLGAAMQRMAMFPSG